MHFSSTERLLYPKVEEHCYQCIFQNLILLLIVFFVAFVDAIFSALLSSGGNKAL